MVNFRSVGNAAGQVATGTGNCAITPTMPTGAVVGDRIYVVQVYRAAGSGSGSSATPSGWDGFKDISLSASVECFLSIYYRDYDGVWSMPSFTLTGSNQKSHLISTLAVYPSVGYVLDPPTAGGILDTSSNTTLTLQRTTTTITGALLLACVGLVSNAPAGFTSWSLSQPGATLTTLTERTDAGSTNSTAPARAGVATSSVTSGSPGSATISGTAGWATPNTTGGCRIVQQTESLAPAVDTTDFFAMF